MRIKMVFKTVEKLVLMAFRVELYKDNGDGLNDPTTDTRVGFTSTANGGLYLFSSIPVGDYYAVFFLPPGYTTSTANTTTDDKDSDGILGTFNGNKVTIVPLTNIASAENRFDMGPRNLPRQSCRWKLCLV